MKKYSYKKVNAFTGGMSLGNPAAFLMLNDDCLEEQEFLKIAKEHAGFVSEVVFCSHSKNADYKLTYYSSECEVDFCGHGTIATMYELIKNNDALYNKDEIVIETNRKGLLTIYNKIQDEDAIYITAPCAKYLQLPASNEQIALALSIDIRFLSKKYPVDFVDAGLKTLIVPIAEYKNEISIFPNEEKLKIFCLTYEIDIVLIFSQEASSNDFVAHTRVFAPKFGYLEDPATGSGNSAFGNYMLKNKMWNGEPICIEQGAHNMLFNTIKLKKQGDGILFGGTSTLRIDGTFIVE